MKFFHSIVFLFFFGLSAWSQGKYVRSSVQTDVLTIETTEGKLEIRAYAENCLEVLFQPTNEMKVYPSHAIVKKPLALPLHVSNSNPLLFVLDGFQLEIIDQDNVQLRFSYKNKLLITQEKMEDKTIQLGIDHQEALYGGGARALGMNRRGNRLQLYNRAHYGYEERSELMNFTMPLFLSSKSYAVHFDNTFTGYLDLDAAGANKVLYEPEGGPLRYQIIAGKNLRDVTESYTQLTGLQPLIPLWALGNFSSRFGYHSQEEVLSTIAKFKSDSIPVDAVILDLYWFGKEIQGTLGNLAFDTDSFPQPKQMVETLQQQNVQTVLITEPFVLSTSKRWDEAVEKQILATDSLGKPYRYDFYFGNTALIDLTQSKGKSWFWNIYKEHYQLGVRGFWGDLGEPEVHPADLFHGEKRANEVHNVYGHLWAKTVSEGFQELAPNYRPFILMRAGYSGSQRFGMIPWSGDVNRTWGGLKPQMEIALQMGMQGMAFMHSDLGGFAGANDDRQLYVRWLQYGVFQPIFRPHAQEQVASEPVFKDAETKRLAKKAIDLRYELLPYNFSMVMQNHLNGTPLMRPLMYEEPENSDLLNVASTYLWGDHFLVHPIVDSNVESVQMYFPKSAMWYDWYTNEKVPGGQTLSLNTHRDYIPTYVRAGSFIATTPGLQSTKGYLKAGLTVHYFSGEMGETVMDQVYLDGSANGMEPWKISSVVFRACSKKKNWVLEMESKTELLKEIHWVLHGAVKPVKKIKINGKKVGFKQINGILYFEQNVEINQKIVQIVIK